MASSRVVLIVAALFSAALLAACSRSPDASPPPPAAATPVPTSAPAPAAARVEWPVYGGNLASQFYSPLDQINARNVKDLKVAWRLVRGQLRAQPRAQEREHAADDRRRAVCDRRRHAQRRGDRRRHGRDAVGVAAERARARSSRRRARWRGAASRTGATGRRTRPRVRRDAGLLSVVARCDDRLAEARVRRSGVVDLRRGLRGPADNVEAGSSSPALVVGDVVIVGPAGGIGARPNSKTAGQARRARLRRAQRQAAVDVPHDSGARASSATTRGSRRARPSTRATPACGRR